MKKVCYKILTLYLSIVISLATIELTFRIFNSSLFILHLQATEVYNRAFVRYGEHWIRIPNKEFRSELLPMRSVECVWSGIHILTTNSLAMKDRQQRIVPLNPDHTRILFIGDSFVEGVGFEYDRTFVGIVDKKLSEKNVEVLNAGVAGHSPSIYYRRIISLWERGVRFKHLIVGIDISDIRDEVDIRKCDGAGYKWDDWSLNEDAWNQYGKEGMNTCQAYMKKIKEFCDSNSIEMTILVWPWLRNHYQNDPCRQETMWKEWCASNTCGFISLFPLFSIVSNNEIETYYIPDDCHFSAKGNRIIGDFLAERLYSQTK